MLFGDGAGAVLVGCDGEGDIGPIVLAADGSLADRITASHDKRVLDMDGHSTYQVAVKRLSEATVAAVARAGLELDDIDLFVYHQANGRIIRAVGERLDLEPAQASPTTSRTWQHVRRVDPAHARACCARTAACGPASRCCVAAIGAGFTWGAGVVEWGIA